MEAKRGKKNNASSITKNWNYHQLCVTNSQGKTLPNINVMLNSIQQIIFDIYV